MDQQWPPNSSDLSSLIIAKLYEKRTNNKFVSLTTFWMLRVLKKQICQSLGKVIYLSWVELLR